MRVIAHTCRQLDIKSVDRFVFPRWCDGTTYPSGAANLKNREYILEQRLRQVDHEDRVLTMGELKKN